MGEPLERAVEVIRGGGVVAAATDTLVGLLALARSETAVARVLAIKGPGRATPIPVLVPDLDTAASLVAAFPEAARQRAEAGWPGPLTLVLPARPGLPSGLTAGRRTLGLRIPGPSAALDLVRLVGEPLTGTSANRTGEPAVADTDELDAAVAAEVDLVVRGRARLASPSEVVDYTVDPPRVLRPGPTR